MSERGRQTFETMIECAVVGEFEAERGYIVKAFVGALRRTQTGPLQRLKLRELS